MAEGGFDSFIFLCLLHAFIGPFFRYHKTWKKWWVFCFYMMFVIDVFALKKTILVMHPCFSTQPARIPVLKGFLWNSYPELISQMKTVRAVSLWEWLGGQCQGEMGTQKFLSSLKSSLFNCIGF